MKLRVRRHEVVQPHDQAIKLIALTRGQNAIVDTEDYEWLNQHNWRTEESRNTLYAVRQQGRKTVYMHRELMHITNGEVDHKNHYGLDNRKENLRPCNHLQNLANMRRPNKCGFKGVTKYKNRWTAKIRMNGKRRFLGSFESPEAAAHAYDNAARKVFGEFAHLNFP